MRNALFLSSMLPAILFTLALSAQTGSELLDGDVIFQTSRSPQSRAIQLATHSRYSHVGMIVRDGEKAFVLEAVEPVKLTPLDRFIARGEKRQFIVKRMKRPLSAEERSKVIAAAREHLGKHYDLAFSFDDEAMYCSELVYKAYRDALSIDLAAPKPLKSYDLHHPAVRAKLVERYGQKLPLEEPMVAPQDLFDSPLLEPVP